MTPATSCSVNRPPSRTKRLPSSPRSRSGSSVRARRSGANATRGSSWSQTRAPSACSRSRTPTSRRRSSTWRPELPWDVQHASALRPMADAIDDPTHRALVDAVLDRFEAFVAPRWPQLRSQVIHGDVTLDNALVDEHGRISGIVDWGDMSHSALVCDVTSALESLLAGRNPAQVVPLALRFVDGYRSITPLEPEELAVLPDLLATRLVTVAVLFSWRARRHPDNDYLRRFETTLWPLLTYLVDDGCDRLRARLRVTEAHLDDTALTARRERAFGPAL